MKYPYAKEVMAVLVALGAALVTALGTSPQQSLSNFTTKDWVLVIGAVLASGAVTAIPENIQGIAGGIAKAVVATGSAFVTALITAYADDIITQAELIGAFSAAIVAFTVVYQATNLVRAAGTTGTRLRRNP